jgi:hypothetical protein
LEKNELARRYRSNDIRKYITAIQYIYLLHRFAFFLNLVFILILIFVIDVQKIFSLHSLTSKPGNSMRDDLTPYGGPKSIQGQEMSHEIHSPGITERKSRIFLQKGNEIEVHLPNVIVIFHLTLQLISLQKTLKEQSYYGVTQSVPFKLKQS